MSLPEVSHSALTDGLSGTLFWLVPATLGVLLASFSSKAAYALVRRFRGFLWTAFLSTGDLLLFPFTILSLIVSLLAALPLATTLLPASTSSFSAHVSNQPHFVPLLLLTLSVFVRFWIYPACNIDWSRVRRWEQEVVRRTETLPPVSLKTLFHGETQARWSRVSQLSRAVVESEMTDSLPLRVLPRRSLGLLLIHSAGLSLAQGAWKNPLELKVAIVGLCITLFFADLRPEARPQEIPWHWLLAGLVPAIALGVFRLHFSHWPIFWSKHSLFIHDFERFCLLVTVFLFFLRDLRTIIKPLRRRGLEIGTGPVDRRYFFLRKINDNVSWLGNTGNLVLLLIQLDLLLATLRITLS
ncbi:hypothetical protein EBU99_06755 [bacterium]|nr:hypothetical protein [bacterium]